MKNSAKVIYFQPDEIYSAENRYICAICLGDCAVFGDSLQTCTNCVKNAVPREFPAGNI